MEIRHENIRCALLAWAAESSQENVASTIAATYIRSGGKELPLTLITDPVGQRHESWRNQQNIFHRWLSGETPEQRRKLQLLLPAISETIPPLLRLRMEFADSAEYRAVVHAKEQLNRAFDDLLRAVLSGAGARQADRARDGPVHFMAWLFPIISLTTGVTT
ncbi:hypothetical protein RU50_001302 [Salmonella enterica subsp. enterica]|nr:hypothetical protein [Salmonella enterica subsp. enterica]